MIKKISAVCTRKLISIGNLHDMDVPVLCYGCELILTSVIGLVLLITASLLIGHPFAWLFFTIGFAPHRTFAGGYHADTHLGCFTVTTLLFFIGTVAAYELNWHRYTYILVGILSLVLVLLMAPLEAENKPLSSRRYRSNRIRSIVVSGANIVMAVFFAAMNAICAEANLYYASIVLASASLIMGKIKKYMKD